MEADGLTGVRVAGARREAGLTQRALAERLGVAIRTLQNYESGRFVPYRHLHELARLLHRSIPWLLSGAESPEARGPALVGANRRQRELLASNLRRLADLRQAMDAHLLEQQQRLGGRA